MPYMGRKDEQMAHHCLRDAKGKVGYFTDYGALGLRVDGDVIEITVGRGLHFEIPRDRFDHLVDEYIGTPAIRAALKAKDEEIARLTPAKDLCTICGRPRSLCDGKLPRASKPAP